MSNFTRKERANFQLRVGLLLETQNAKKKDGTSIEKLFRVAKPTDWQLGTLELLFRKKGIATGVVINTY
ncbi:hypothetical protein PL373_19130 [Tenacibaculum maritimum]|nr:hypothetical protein [Tenacibaculum maritimum]MDB0603203.1 hypothetical protein [Tenacibaculum maritimum]MDB0610465.1 hypothetical protein [Tenacibaculum maritimum]